MKLSKLLLVEDSQEAADLIISILEYAGHKVTHKETGEEGLHAVKTEYFDGILLDYMLPDIMGTELCRMMRELSIDVPIIITSSHLNALTPQILDEVGATTFVPKPVSQNIVHIVTKHVERQSLARMEGRKPETVVKKFLGQYAVDGKG